MVATVCAAAAQSLTEDSVCGQRDTASLCRFLWRYNQHGLGPSEMRQMTEGKRLRSIRAWQTGARIADPERDSLNVPPLLPARGLSPCQGGAPLEEGYAGTWGKDVGSDALTGKQCVLPMSRSYLLSDFGAAIEAVPEDAEALTPPRRSGGLKPGDEVKVRFRACSVGKSQSKSVPWRDVWSRNTTLTPGGSERKEQRGQALDLVSLCPRLDLWARLVENRRHDSTAFFTNSVLASSANSSSCLFLNLVPEPPPADWGAESIRAVMVKYAGTQPQQPQQQQQQQQQQATGWSSALSSAAAEACKWEVSFVVPEPAPAALSSPARMATATAATGTGVGMFRLEVSNIWVDGLYGAGSQDWAGQASLADRLKCNCTPGFAWRGQDAQTMMAATFLPIDVVAAGGNYMDCCDRCTMHEQCQSWTFWGGNGQDHCWFFSTPPPTSVPPHARTPFDDALEKAEASLLLHGRQALAKRRAAFKGLMRGEHNHAWSGVDPELSSALKRLFGAKEVFSGLRRAGEPLALHLGGRHQGGNSPDCSLHSRVIGSPFRVNVDSGSGAEAKPDMAKPDMATSGAGTEKTRAVKAATGERKTVGAAELVAKECPRSLVGQAAGKWARFDAQLLCSDHSRRQPPEQLATRAYAPPPRLLTPPGPQWWVTAAVANLTARAAEARGGGTSTQAKQDDAQALLRLAAHLKAFRGQPAHSDVSGLVLNLEPMCGLLHLKGNLPKMGPGQGPAEYEEGGWSDLTWELDRHRMKHYTRLEARQCLLRRNISTIYTAGDSVMGGFRAALAWLVSTVGKDDAWYADGGDGGARVFKGDVAVIERWEHDGEGGNHSSSAVAPHVVEFLAYQVPRTLEESPVESGAAWVNGLNLPQVRGRDIGIGGGDKSKGARKRSKNHAAEGAENTVVLVSNFGIHHFLWRHSVNPWLNRTLKGFAHGAKQRLASLALHNQIRGFDHLIPAENEKDRGENRRDHPATRLADGVTTEEEGFADDEDTPTAELILMLPSVVHGSREPYVTYARSLEAAKVMLHYLGGGDEEEGPSAKQAFARPHQRRQRRRGLFRVLDTQAPELARPEMSADGLHYSDAMNYMHVQQFLGMLCNDP